MSYLRSVKVNNGGLLINWNFYSCDVCKCEIDCSWPHYEDHGKHWCVECAFRVGLIDEIQYVDNVGGISSRMFAAGINPYNGNIELVRGSIKVKKTKKHGVNRKVRLKRGKFSWEVTSNKRNHPKYKEWRLSVFKRDLFTCQKCKQIGGELNAHHIMSFAEYPKLRYEITNGITLCESCHREEHKKR